MLLIVTKLAPIQANISINSTQLLHL